MHLIIVDIGTHNRSFKTNGKTSYDTNHGTSKVWLSEVVENGRLVGTRTPDLHRVNSKTDRAPSCSQVHSAAPEDQT